MTRGRFVRGALIAVGALPVLFGDVALALWIAHQLNGMLTPLFSWLMTRLKLPPGYFQALLQGIGTPVLWLFGTATAIIVLTQSLAQFRQAHRGIKTIVKDSAILLVFILVSTFWLADTVNSVERQRSQPAGTTKLERHWTGQR